ncbi:MAG TPA: DUF5693 family protein [Pseudothermotoga sp.]
MDMVTRLKRISSWLFLLISITYLIFFIPVRINSDRKAMNYSVGFTLDDKRIVLQNGEIVWVIEPGEKLEDHMKYVIFKGDFSQVDPASYIQDIDRYKIFVGILEFNESLPFAKRLASQRSLKDLIFRVHTVRQEEVDKLGLDETMIYYRLRRAILERSIDLLWIQPLNNVNTQAVLERLERQFGKPVSFPMPQKDFQALRFIPFLAILFALTSYKIIAILPSIAALPFGFPISVSVASITATATLYFSTRKKKLLPLFYLLLGLLTYASLSDFNHMNDLDQFRGVKLSLIALPAILVTITLVRHWKWLKRYLPYFLVAGGFFGFYYISRSGNIAFVPDVERKLRDLIEGLLWVRPRFKEVVLYPVYFISLRFTKFKWNFVLEILGSIALVSTFNTFCHIKTPLIVSLYRSVFSILLGYIAYYIVRRLRWS